MGSGKTYHLNDGLSDRLKAAGPGPGDVPPSRGPGGGQVDGGRGGRGSEAATKAKPKVKKPSMYRVLLLNDDYTPMEFVVYVLESFFNKSREQATQIMLHVHQHGVGVCGVFSYEVAETKVAQVLDLARRNEHPLQCTMEKD
jgi:ATP-dependent Clp protease adaptor protein ClpS